MIQTPTQLYLLAVETLAGLSAVEQFCSGHNSRLLLSGLAFFAMRAVRIGCGVR